MNLIQSFRETSSQLIAGDTQAEEPIEQSTEDKNAYAFQDCLRQFEAAMHHGTTVNFPLALDNVYEHYHDPKLTKLALLVHSLDEYTTPAEKSYHLVNICTMLIHSFPECQRAGGELIKELILLLIVKSKYGHLQQIMNEIGESEEATMGRSGYFLTTLYSCCAFLHLRLWDASQDVGQA